MSKIEVDAITQQSGTTVTVGGGACKTAVIDATTVTLGRCGGTVALAAGASQTGFGRTGTVDWQTTPKTGNFTAVNGEGYFVNTTSGAVVMTMPSGSAGAIVSIQDYNKTFDSNALTISPASGERINGGNADGNLIITTEGQGLTFVYVDATVGWKTVHENEFIAGGSSFLVASGGTESISGNCKIHTFTGPGTFTVAQTSATAAENVISYLVIASGGGGGGGSNGSGGGSGGGAGGFREFKSPVTPYTASPLVGSTPITVTAQSYPVVVGAGAAGGGASTPTGNATNGNVSSVFGISSAGGGGGKYGPCGSQNGSPGGSGSGASGGNPGCKTGGSGNTPPVSPSQGNNGGNSGAFPQPAASVYDSAGGGGAGGVGQNSQPGPRAGGLGVATNITNSPVTYAAGGNGGSYTPATTPISNAPDNSGTGGAGKSTGPGGAPALAGANGGSGIVVIRYKFQ